MHPGGTSKSSQVDNDTAVMVATHSNQACLEDRGYHFKHGDSEGAPRQLIKNVKIALGEIWSLCSTVSEARQHVA